MFREILSKERDQAIRLRSRLEAKLSPLRKALSKQEAASFAARLKRSSWTRRPQFGNAIFETLSLESS
jgi:uncharacterized membrane protein